MVRAASIAIEDISYRIGNTTISGIAFGDKNSPIVLCLHGWLDNAASFVPLIPHITGKRVIAIDFPGHGLSSHRSLDAHYHFFDWVDDLLLLFNDNNWQAVDIIGHSMGGMVGSAFAAAFPEKVNSLTLIDIVGFLTSEAEQTTELLRKGLQSRQKARLKKPSIYKRKALAVQARIMASDLNIENAKHIVERSLEAYNQEEHSLDDQAKGYTWRYDQRLNALSPYRMTLVQAQQLIKDIKIPVQLIRGKHGLELVDTGLTYFSDLFPSLHCHTLTGGHHIHMEQPAASAKLILDFIANK